MKTKIQELQTLASDKIGDGKSPNLFFVTDEGIVVTVTRDFNLAYRQWLRLANQSPRRECALEDRRAGTLASVEPCSDEKGARLEIHDDTRHPIIAKHIKRN